MRYTEYVRLADLFLSQVNARLRRRRGIRDAQMDDGHAGRREVTVYELDPRVVEMGRRYFGLEDYPSLHVVTGDARQNLAASREQYDFLFGDAYNGVRWCRFI